MQFWDFEHPLSTENVLLCCNGRYLLLMKCFITFLRCIETGGGASDSIYETLMVHNVSFLPTTHLKFHSKFQFSRTLSAKGVWCCVTKRDTHCWLNTSYYSLHVLEWLEELPVSSLLIWASYGTQHVISTNNQHQISCKFEILSTLLEHEMCCCATRRGDYC